MRLPKEVWYEALKALERTIPKYDIGNKTLSLFQDWRIRKIALSILLSKKIYNKVLDLGGGPGTLEGILSKHFKQVIYIDFSKAMIAYAKKKHQNHVNIDYIRATFEYIPLREGSMDVGIASYALRDSLNLPKALTEISRTIHKKLVIVDVGKPDNKLLAKIIEIYLKSITPIITSITTGWIKGNPWKLLYKTFTYLLPNSTYKKLVEKIFGKATMHEYIFGAAVIIIGENENPSSRNRKQTEE